MIKYDWTAVRWLVSSKSKLWKKHFLLFLHFCHFIHKCTHLEFAGFDDNCFERRWNAICIVQNTHLSCSGSVWPVRVDRWDSPVSIQSQCFLGFEGGLHRWFLKETDVNNVLNSVPSCMFGCWSLCRMNEARTFISWIHARLFYLYKGHLDTDLTVCGLITIETL